MQIQTLLQRLDIQHLTHKNICEQHIFPIFENEQRWKDKSSEILISYVTYIFDLWSKQVRIQFIFLSISIIFLLETLYRSISIKIDCSIINK
jgi:hypothetical protein